MANTKTCQNIIENLNTKDKTSMNNSEWFFLQQQRRKREEKKKSLNKDKTSTVKDTEPNTQG
jgi:hypothetical protein